MLAEFLGKVGKCSGSAWGKFTHGSEIFWKEGKIWNIGENASLAF